LALKQAEQEILERKTARWVYEQGRGVTAKEVARRFRLHVHTARLVIHRIMRRTDGIRCELLGTYEQTAKGLRQVKYFSVIYLPDKYQPAGRKKV
jgi:transposase